jgi:crotonobetainyl-CoA:carnitine CoA-transferase CaiB-like acyl-CoA transferase
MEKTLAGIRVLDMSEGVAGPYAACLLGDMGASITKVERPEGDWSRGYGDTLSPAYVALNRNKLNLCLNLQIAGAGPVIQRLVGRSDVIISNFRKGVMERLGVGYAACKQINPKTIYCTISAFGQKGPYSTLPASDTVIQAISGIMESIGDPEGPPLRVSFTLVDLFAATLAVQGILLGLYARKEGKPGTWVDVSLINAAMSLQSLPFATYMITGDLPKRCGNQNPAISPGGAFKTKDEKYVTIAVLRDSHWEKFCQAIERTDLAQDDRFKDNSSRVRNRNLMNELLIPVFLSRTRREWMSTLQKADVLCAPVNDFADICSDSGLRESLSLLEFDLAGQRVALAGNALNMDGEYTRLANPASNRGENTIEVLESVGYDRSEIGSLLTQGIAFQRERVQEGERGTESSPLS